MRGRIRHAGLKVIRCTSVLLVSLTFADATPEAVLVEDLVISFNLLQEINSLGADAALLVTLQLIFLSTSAALCLSGCQRFVINNAGMVGLRRKLLLTCIAAISFSLAARSAAIRSFYSN